MKYFSIIMFCLICVFSNADEINLNESNKSLNLEENLSFSSENLNENLAVFDKNSTDLNQNMTNLDENTDNKIVELSLESLYHKAHIVVKIVIYILVFFSVLTWTILLAKWLQFFIAFKRIKQDRINLSKFLSLNQSLNLNPKSYLKIMLYEINDEIKKSKIDDDNLLSRIKFRLEINANKLTNNIKQAIAILASIGSSSPFIGLFGTVWGIMNSFISIASSQNASLNVVAPGIAEALFATAIGLVAAIPAVLFYNYLTRLSLKFTHQITYLSNEVYILADREISKDKS